VIHRVNGVSAPREAVPVRVAPARPPRTPPVEPHFTAGIPRWRKPTRRRRRDIFRGAQHRTPGFAALVAGKSANLIKKRPPSERQESLDIEPGWRFPPVALLARPPNRASIGAPSEEALQANDRLLESVLADYGVQAAS